jgi:hypothetical protein
MRYKLALETIAANDDRLVAFDVGSKSELRESLFAQAPDFDFYIYYYHCAVGEYFRLYDGLKREHMTFRRTDLSTDQIERAWDGILNMASVEEKAVKKMDGRAMTPIMAARYPKIPAVLLSLTS